MLFRSIVESVVDVQGLWGADRLLFVVRIGFVERFNLEREGVQGPVRRLRGSCSATSMPSQLLLLWQLRRGDLLDLGRCARYLLADESEEAEDGPRCERATGYVSLSGLRGSC